MPVAANEPLLSSVRMPTDEAIAKLEALRAETLAAVEAAPDAAALRDTEIRYLGRKGPLAAVLSTLGGMEPEERKEVGMVANAVRSALESAVAGRRGSLDSEEAARRLESERVDVTLPGRKPLLGHLHPITQVIDEIVDVFVGLGFKVADGPEVESDYYNFEALNMPQDHPARSMFDTLYIEPNDYGQPLLRTHTSPMWVRAMEEAAPPLYVTMPGRAYRRDVTDPTHLAGFHQIDGLAVDKGISFADLKGSPSPSPPPRSTCPASTATATAAGSVAGRGGSRSWGRGWCTRTSSRRWATTRTSRASPSAWASSASPCCGGRSATSAG